MDPNATKNENFKNLKTYVSSYSPEAILWAISGPYIDHWDPSFFLKLKKSIFGPKMDPISTKNENFKNPKTYVSLYTPEAILWAISGSYIDHWDPSFFLKLEKSIFWPKMDPNSTKNENFKNPKTYVFLYTPKGVPWAISGPYIDHCDPSFF